MDLDYFKIAPVNTNFTNSFFDQNSSQTQTQALDLTTKTVSNTQLENYPISLLNGLNSVPYGNCHSANPQLIAAKPLSHSAVYNPSAFVNGIMPKFDAGQWCPICGIFCRQNLTNHLKSHESRDRLLTCTICHVRLDSMKDVKVHMMAEHNQKVPMAQKRKRVRGEGMAVAETVSGTASVKESSTSTRAWGARKLCGICGMHISSLIHHMPRHTQTEQRSTPCPICPQTWFETAGNLQMHLRQTHGTQILMPEPLISTSPGPAIDRYQIPFIVEPAAPKSNLLEPFGHNNMNTQWTPSFATTSNQSINDQLINSHSIDSQSINTQSINDQLIDGHSLNAPQLSAEHCSPINAQSFGDAEENMHNPTQTDQSSLPCLICPQTWFDDSKQLESHLFIVHGYIMRSTSHGDRNGNVATDSGIHETPAKKRKIKICDICELETNNYLTHKLRHTKTSQRCLPCPFCPQTWFSNVRFVNCHLTRSHATAESRKSFS